MTGLVVDCFAGGGGASTGIERALGRPVDISINHDAKAVAMHAANHPWSRHYCENIFAVDPATVCGGRPVDLAWFSPDCTHHSKARGGKPRKKNIRGLAWIVLRWARSVRPAVIMLENVEEFEDWGPLTADGKPCPTRKGQTFEFWCASLRRHGYEIDWWQLRACDFGAPTIRKRLFLVARRDGLPIGRPEPTHGPAGSGLLPYSTAAEIIDWSIHCPSIFERKRPLVDATLRRIARGIQRYVIDAADPFIIRTDMHSGAARNGVHSIDEPLRTITTKGGLAVVSPTLIQTGYGERQGQAPRVPGLGKPLGTVVAGGAKHALVSAFLAQHNTGMTGHDTRKPVSTITGRGTQQQVVTAHLQRHFGKSVGYDAREPMGTVTAGGGGKTSLVTSHLVKLRGTCRDGQPVDAPMPTVTAGGTHVGEVRAFMVKYYGTGGQWAGCDEPIHTLTAKARMGLVTVTIGGAEYVIVDIGMRMLTPRELFRAQGFPDSYIIDPVVDGKPLNKTDQIEKCGNSVCPDVAEAVIRANMPCAKRADMPLFGEWRASA